MKIECPICGVAALVNKTGEFRFDPPSNIPGGTIVVPNSVWEECNACHEVILSTELIEHLEQQRYIRLGLLSPKEIKAIRIKAGLSQSEISKVLGVGEKSYTRWESGKSLQNKSSDNLIRLFSKDPSLFEELELQRELPEISFLMDYCSIIPTVSCWSERHPQHQTAFCGASKDNRYTPAA